LPKVQINPEDAASKHGITTNHEVMKNGELRFRLNRNDGTAYILTIAGENGAWQNSHSHKQSQETYIVQTGWMAFAELKPGKAPLFRICEAGEVFTTTPGVPHNVYLPKGAVIHTVKHGDVIPDDWFACLELDEATKPLTEEAILSIKGQISS
jgi:hypothetical protein